jgi:hypothetical protein
MTLLSCCAGARWTSRQDVAGTVAVLLAGFLTLNTIPER